MAHPDVVYSACPIVKVLLEGLGENFEFVARQFHVVLLQDAF